MDEFKKSELSGAQVGKTYLEYTDVLNGFDQLSKSIELKNNAWFWLAKIKWENFSQRNREMKNSVKYMCTRDWLENPIDLGNSLGYWGMNSKLKTFLSENGIEIDCAKQTYRNTKLEL